MTTSKNKLVTVTLQHAPLLFFAALLLIFGLLAPRFLEARNLVNILVQSSSVAIVATGMTFVLLTAGIDLSVGSIMFVAAVIAGKLALQGWPLPLCGVVILVVGLVFGAVNAFFITRLKVMAFVVTLATLYAGRGLGLLLSETRAMNLPESLLQIGAARVLGVPFPVLIFGVVVLLAHVTLSYTPFGRQLYALGQDAEAAAKAGLNVARLTFIVYLISGFCAALGGLVAVAQLGAVSPTFGNQREFAAIAAAVLGGTSLFGGRGQVFPGTVLGALLIQTVENGLVIVNADPYLYQLILSAVIFLAVLLDSLRSQRLQALLRRRIRND